MSHPIWRAFLRFAFHHFYTTFAFTYDFVSALVSRGQWRMWTNAAMPHLVGTRILEVPCGTGTLLLDLRADGYAPIGVDLSPAMLRIAQNKFRRAHTSTPILRASVQALPFAAGSFDSVVMTFPPSFVYDPQTFVEIYRVLDKDGRFIWVDGGRLLPRDWYSRALNFTLDALSSGDVPYTKIARDALAKAGFETRIVTQQDQVSAVMVIIASNRKT